MEVNGREGGYSNCGVHDQAKAAGGDDAAAPWGNKYLVTPQYLCIFSLSYLLGQDWLVMFTNGPWSKKRVENLERSQFSDLMGEFRLAVWVLIKFSVIVYMR